MGNRSQTWTGSTRRPACGRRSHLWRLRGEDREQLASAERFDPQTGMWEVLQPMPTARAECAAATSMDRLYVFGGDTGDSCCAAERFDPEVHTLEQARAWDVLPSMPTARICCAAAAAAR